jgi:hypothetical protein
LKQRWINRSGGIGGVIVGGSVGIVDSIVDSGVGYSAGSRRSIFFI